MATIDFSEDELRVLSSILNQLSYKTRDSRLVLPILDKIEALIPPSQPPEAGDSTPKSGLEVVN